MNVYSPECTYYFLPTESQFRTDSSPWCELNVNAVTLHITSLHWLQSSRLTSLESDICWHLLTSDDILETAETLNRCQSQIWYWIQKYKEIRRHSKSKESERDPKRNGTRLETLLASLGVSWRLESRLRSDDPFHILVQVLPLKLDLKALRNSSTKLKTVVKHKVVKL